jgi:hypothetical protein
MLYSFTSTIFVGIIAIAVEIEIEIEIAVEIAIEIDFDPEERKSQQADPLDARTSRQ